MLCCCASASRYYYTRDVRGAPARDVQRSQLGAPCVAVASCVRRQAGQESQSLFGGMRIWEGGVGFFRQIFPSRARQADGTVGGLVASEKA
jgi:hypothetical protein